MITLLLTTALAADAWDLEPHTTRAGTLRFLLPEDRDQALTDSLMERLATGGEDTAVRVALVEALPRSGGDWSSALALWPSENGDVRQTLVDGARHADQALAVQLIELALDDGDWEVRAAGARAAGWQTELGDELGPEVLDALADAHPEVRAFAARSAGWLHLDAFGALLPLLADVDPTVRLNTLRALERIDATALQARPELATLSADADARVSRAASGLQ